MTRFFQQEAPGHNLQHWKALQRRFSSAGLVGALRALQQELQKIGSRLLILEGKAEILLPQLAEQHGATAMVTEAEVEHRYALFTPHQNHTLMFYSITSILYWC